MSRVDAFFSNGLGDAVMSLPAVAALKQHFGDGFRLRTDSRIYNDVLAGGFGPHADPGARRNALRRREMTEKIPADLAPIVMWMNTWIDAPYLEALANTGRLVVGSFEQSHVWLNSPSTLHDFERYFLFAEAVGAGEINEYFGWPSETQPSELCSAAPCQGPFVIVHLETGVEKMLPAAVEARLLKRLALTWPDRCFVSIGRRPLRHGSELPPNVVELVGLPLSPCVGLIARAEAFVGYDSAFLHVADLLGTPSLGLFCSTSPAEYGVLRTIGSSLEIPSSFGVDEEHVIYCLKALLYQGAEWRSWRDGTGQRYWSRLRSTEEASGRTRRGDTGAHV